MTMTIPNTFTGDTYLSAVKMSGNFDYIKSYLNGGIAAADLSATAAIRLSQVSENHSLDSFCFTVLTGGTLIFPVLNAIEVAEVSVTTTKSDTSYGAAIAMLWQTTDRNIIKVTNNDNPALFNSGYFACSPRIQLASGFYNLTISKDTNVSSASVRIGFVQKHTKV